MSETKTTRKQLPAYLILALIALAAALLLAVTNAITAGPIKAHEEAAQNAAFQSVMEADSFSTMSIPDGCNVTSLVEAKKDGKTIGYCAVSSAKGYGGDISVMTGVDKDGKVTGVNILSHSETAGLGANAVKESFRDQFVGLVKGITVSKDKPGENSIDALTGATVTSRAVTKAVNAAIEAAGGENDG